ncbi:ABC transporter permease [Paenibacillus planticolens]|uniref:ABC transporter permease subunit n=1 Tax=Paenibacillus planticolens TaxID=2654976 RepID=A0ABX2A0J4_9BACL|nr:ABC transporter permease [Paenibacillus planticolens]NOV04500.1 ABC transporter permease subunit [Paenibacillus planticolens]
MIRLIQAELLKIYNRPLVWSMVALLFMMVSIMAILHINYNNKTVTSDWKAELLEENRLLTIEMQEAPEEIRPYINSQVKQNEYALNNGISPKTMSVWKFVNSAAKLLPFVTLFTLIIASSVVASEYRWGTMQLLLIRPISRYKLLLAKYVVILLFAAVLLAIVFVVSWIAGAILFGTKGAMEPYVFARDRVNFQSTTYINKLLITYGLKIITLFVIVTMAFVISVLFRSSSFAIGFSVFILFSGNMFTSILYRINVVMAKLSLFTHLNLEVYFTGTPPVEGISLLFSLGVLLGYVIAFYLVGWIAFARRELV